MPNTDLNICLIIVDSLRADHLSCYGYKKKTSANIDKISENSFLFKNAVSQSNWTYASLYSLISGRYPGVHNITWFDQQIDTSLVTLPEVLEEAGYQTALFSSFRTLINKKTFGKHFNETKLINIDEDVKTVFSNWFRNNPRSFSIFHIGDYVHEPYFADKKYVDMFYKDGYEGLKIDEVLSSITSTATKGFAEKMIDINRKLNLRIKRLSKKQLAYLIACYDAGIYHVDKFIGDFYKLIRNELKNYLFIITADHGQCFFEHGFYGHGLQLYDEVTRVPLIVDMNQLVKGAIDEPVQHIDIYPTLAQFLGLKEKVKKLDGISFDGILKGNRALESRLAISESYPFISIRNKSHKLITTHFKLQKNKGLLKELFKNIRNKNIRRFLFNCYALYSPTKFYNILNDPEEQNNITGREKQTQKLLFERLTAVFENSQQEALDPVSITMDDEIKQQLANLGYM